MSLQVFIAFIVALVAAGLFLVGVETDHHVLRLATKGVPVLLMAWLVLTRARHAYGRWIASGLLACLAGDMLLEWSASTFLLGVGAFLVGHVLYTLAYVGRSREVRPWLALPFVAWGTAVLALLRPGLESAGMLIPVTIYTVAIMVMIWRAACCWRADGGSAVSLLALAGALVFGASDTLLAVGRFDEPFAGIRYAVILTYWLGQLGITASALRFRPEVT